MGQSTGPARGRRDGDEFFLCGCEATASGISLETTTLTLPRQICPPPWLCRNGGGERTVTARVCVWEFGFSGQSVYRLSTVHGDAQTKYFREGIIV